MSLYTRPLTVFSCFVLLLCGQASLLQGADPGQDRPLRVLTIGNSFSRNAVRHLPELAKASGHKLQLQELIIGGASFEVHWTKWEKAQKNPSDPAGLYVFEKNLKEWLTAESWDIVTVQQASIKSHNYDTYQPFAGKLHAFIREHAPAAEILVHQTWAYRRDDPRFFVKEPKAGEPKTQEEMYRRLTNAYATLAKEFNVRRIPVGDAFYLADMDEQWGYQPDASFDAKKANAPVLPDQAHSLHVGWQWKKQKDGTTKLSMDGHHANMAGEYLGACVWHEVLFKQSAVGNSYLPKGLDPAYGKFLQETAHRAVAASPQSKPRSE